MKRVFILIAIVITFIGMMIGYSADIINEIAKRLNITKVDVKDTSFFNLLNRLNTDNDIDLATGGIYITPKREEYVSFTQPLYKETETVIVPKSSKINFKDDLKDAILGAEKGTVYAELAQKWKDDKLIKDLVLFDSISDLLEAINNGKVDAGIADSITVNYLLTKEKRFSLRTLKDYTPQLPGEIGIAVKKNDITLLNELNKVITEMKADGTLYSILVQNGLDKSNILKTK